MCLYRRFRLWSTLPFKTKLYLGHFEVMLLHHIPKSVKHILQLYEQHGDCILKQVYLKKYPFVQPWIQGSIKVSDVSICTRLIVPNVTMECFCYDPKLWWYWWHGKMTWFHFLNYFNANVINGIKNIWQCIVEIRGTSVMAISLHKK